LVAALEVFAKKCMETMERIRSKESIQDIPLIKEEFERCCTLVSLCEDQSPREEDMAEVVQREMEAMDLAIRDAVDKFTRLLENSRANDTGMQLEVNFVALLLWYVSGLQRRWEKVLKIHC
ncbi:uncharacterized protein LOC119569195, partial [Penaeus monodon]|uniref:uncharacterized protein LOC119569195 n=1 Tax=Penaeus monodon TaxID=6687 RepID=UPI0018A73B86